MAAPDIDININRGFGSGKGRPKGAGNKATAELRDTIKWLVIGQTRNVERWFNEVADGAPEKGVKADPGRAISLLVQLAEYALPKLARVEHTGNEGPVQISMIERVVVDRDAGELLAALREKEQAQRPLAEQQAQLEAVDVQPRVIEPKAMEPKAISGAAARAAAAVGITAVNKPWQR